jgi:hypothetical protein
LNNRVEQTTLSNRVKGRGNQIQTKFLLSTLTLALPHRKGEEIIEKISNIFG